MEHFRDIPALQEAIAQAKTFFPDRTATQSRAFPEERTGMAGSAAPVHPASQETRRAEAKSAPSEREASAPQATPPAPASGRTEQPAAPLRTDRKEPVGRKASVLAALREHQKKVNTPGKDSPDKTRNTQRKKGEHAL